MATATKEVANGSTNKGDLFPTVGSSNFLGFEFGGKSYSQQLQEAVASTGKFSAVTVEIRELNVRCFLRPKSWLVADQKCFKRRIATVA